MALIGNHQADGKMRRGSGEPQRGARGVDLNHAGIDQLAALPAVGHGRADNLMRHRPFKSWEDLASVPGFDTGIVDTLRRVGAHL